MLTNLLMYRILIWNAIGSSVLVWVWLQGYIQRFFVGEAANVGALMVVVFVFGIVSLWVRASKVSRGLNDMKAGKPVDASKFSIKNAHIGSIGVWLVTLGLIGNMLGFSHAVDGFDSSSPTAALESVSHMIEGMKIAFYTTLIGTTLGLWLQVNFQMLKTATALAPVVP